MPSAFRAARVGRALAVEAESGLGVRFDPVEVENDMVLILMETGIFSTWWECTKRGRRGKERSKKKKKTRSGAKLVAV